MGQSSMIQSNYHMNFSGHGDSRSSFATHPFGNQNSLLPNVYNEPRHRISGSSFPQPISLTSSNGLDYTSQLSQQSPCNTTGSHHILTPPNSGDESSTGISNPSLTSFSYPSHPRASAGNATGSEFCPTGYISEGYNGSAMTSMSQRGGLVGSGLAPTSSSAYFQPYDARSSYLSPNSTMRSPRENVPMYRGLSSYSYATGMPSMHAPSFAPDFPNSYINTQTTAASSRQEGPPFHDTKTIFSISNSQGNNLEIDINASIPKGFFRVEDKWTCYRRNYFNVTCSFAFKTHGSEGQNYLRRFSGQERILGYAVSISAKTASATNAESEPRGLVQHTPKRDKATESVPTRHTVVATPSQSASNSHGQSHTGLYAPGPHYGLSLANGLDHFGSPTSSSPQTSYCFERIQFQKATANNGKRRAQQQYFHIVVKLEANVASSGSQDEWVVIATKDSHPMVVRGRSPGHYKDGRRDSQGSMDPDTTGHNGEASHLPYPHQSMRGGNSTGINSMTASYRTGHHYGGSFNHVTHQSIDDLISPSQSPETPATLSLSPSKDELGRQPVCRTRSSHDDAMLTRQALSPLINKTSGISGFPHSRKRAFEEDHGEYGSAYHSNHMDQTHDGPHFDFSATSATHSLCATT